MFATILANWKLIAGGIAAVVVLGFVYLFIARGERIDALIEEKGALQAQLDQSVATANQNAAKAKELQATADRNAAIVAETTKNAEARIAAARKREREILNVSKDKDGAVAPVLVDTLERLRLARSLDRKD